jgi:hypothetical protein
MNLFQNCSWNYRFDSYENHFNIVYPDKNAVYFGMVIPPGSSHFQVASDTIHPVATYFSVQIYEVGGVAYHYNDVELLTESGLTNTVTPYDLELNLTPSQSYFALFRIYDSQIKGFWAGMPPKTFIDGYEYLACDIDYSQQDNISTNFTQSVNSDTGTVCSHNNQFMSMPIPPGSLANADANYMIACIAPAQSYTVHIKLPQIMCSLNHGERPHIDDEYDLRYASLSLVSTSAPRPTIFTYKLPCNITDYQVKIDVPANLVLPALLYRQLLPNPSFKHSIQRAKHVCKYEYECFHAIMGEYYPKIVQTT